MNSPVRDKLYSSVSSLALYERCPVEYKAWKIDKREPPFAGALQTGTNVHNQIAADLTGEVVTEPHRSFRAYKASRFNREPIAVEQWLEAELEPCNLVGRIDAIYAADEGIEIVDWKCAHGSQELYESAIQLPLYCMAMARVWERPVTDFRYSYFCLYSRREYSGVMTADLEELMSRRVQKLCAGISVGDYSRGCGECWVCRGRA